MWQSLKEYVPAFGQAGWAVGLGFVAAVVGLLLNVSGTPTLPTWLWVALAFATLAAVGFVAFHNLRTARDATNEGLHKEIAGLKADNHAILQFGEPECYLDETVVAPLDWELPSVRYIHPTRSDSEPAREDVPVCLWRITLTNCQPHSRAESVRVRIVSSEPHLDVLPVDLHEMHDESPPFRQKRDMRYDESIHFDVISKRVAGDALYLYRSDLANTYVYALPDHELEKIHKKLRAGGIILTVQPIADPPTRAEKQRSYRVFIDKSGSFRMEWAPDYDELSI